MRSGIDHSPYKGLYSRYNLQTHGFTTQECGNSVAFEDSGFIQGDTRGNVIQSTVEATGSIGVFMCSRSNKDLARRHPRLAQTTTWRSHSMP